MNKIPLKCKCGSVQGTLTLSSPDVGNHVVCYCEDCQAFARHLSDSKDILDEWGGTEIYQTAPWNVIFHAGHDQVSCLRLTRKGLYRWYAGCCQTPIGNTLSAKVPFVGLIHSFINAGDQAESLLGPIRGYHKLESAKGKVPSSVLDKGMPLGTTILVFWRLLKWKLTGGKKPNPFFTADGKCISRPRVVDADA